MEPEVLYFIPCDEVQQDPNNYYRLTIRGLLLNMQPKGEPAFPCTRSLDVLALFRVGDAAGVAGELITRIVQESTHQVIFRTPPRQVRFVNDPEQSVGFLFRIQNCSFPEAGLYWVECLFSGTVLACPPTPEIEVVKTWNLNLSKPSPVTR